MPTLKNYFNSPVVGNVGRLQGNVVGVEEALVYTKDVMLSSGVLARGGGGQAPPEKRFSGGAKAALGR